MPKLDLRYQHFDKEGHLVHCPNKDCACQTITHYQGKPAPVEEPLPDNPVSAPIVSFIRKVKKLASETKETVVKQVKKILNP